MVKNSKKILVIHVSGRVGDTLLITPLLETISKHFKNSVLTALIHRNTVDLLENCKYADHIGTISKKRARYRGWTFFKKYDLAFVSSSSNEDADSLVAYACRTSKKVVAFEPDSSILRKCIYKSVGKNLNEKRHIIKYYHDLTSSINISPIGERISFRATKQELQESKNLLQKSVLKKCDLIIAVKVTGLESRQFRDWPEDNLSELIELLSKRYKNIGFITLGGLNEFDKFEKFAKRVKTPFLNFSKYGVREVGSIMNYVDLYIGVDTGFTQLMSSYNKPMIILYYPNMSSYKFRPVNHPKLCLLEADQQTHLELDKMALMSTIKPKLVFDKIIKLLE